MFLLCTPVKLLQSNFHFNYPTAITHNCPGRSKDFLWWNYHLIFGLYLANQLPIGSLLPGKGEKRLPLNLRGFPSALLCFLQSILFLYIPLLFPTNWVHILVLIATLHHTQTHFSSSLLKENCTIDHKPTVRFLWYLYWLLNFWTLWEKWETHVRVTCGYTTKSFHSDKLLIK